MPGKNASKGLIQDTKEGNNPVNAVDVTVPELDSPTMPMAEPPKPKPEEVQAQNEATFPQMQAPYGLTISDIVKSGTDAGVRALQADRQRTERLIDPQLYDYELIGRSDYPPFLRLDDNAPSALGQGNISDTTQRFLNAPTLQDRINQAAETDPAIRSQMPREVDPLGNVMGEKGETASNIIESVLGVPSVINRSLEQTIQSAWGDNWFTRALTWQPGEKWSIAERQQQPLDSLGQATINTLTNNKPTSYGGGVLGTTFRILDLPGNMARAAGLGAVEGITQTSDVQKAAIAATGGTVFAPAVAAVTGVILNWDRTRSYIERAASGEQFTFANKGGESGLPWTAVGDGTMLEVGGLKLPFVRSAIGLILDSLTEIPGESLMSKGFGAIQGGVDNVVTRAVTQIGQPVQTIEQAATAAKQATNAVTAPKPEAALPVANAPYTAPGPITPFRPMAGVNLDWTPGSRQWMEPGYDPDFVARQILTSDVPPSPLSVLASEPIEPLSVPLVQLDNALAPEEIAQVLPDHLVSPSPVATKLAEDFVSDNINLATTGHVAQSIAVSLSAIEESTKKLINDLDVEQVSRPIDEFGWEQGTVGEQLLDEASRDIDERTLEELFIDADRIGNKYQTPEEVAASNQQLADEVQQVEQLLPDEGPAEMVDFGATRGRTITPTPRANAAPTQFKGKTLAERLAEIRASKKAAPAPAPEANIGRQIHEAGANSVGYGSRMYISDLRDRFPNLTKEEFDKQLSDLELQGRVTMMSNDDPRDIALNPRQEEGKLTIGGTDNHLVYFKPWTETDDIADAITALPPPKSMADEIVDAPETILRQLASDNDNYVPMFKVREAMPNLSRAQQDMLLYKLEREDVIEMSSLQEADMYTAAQIESGIKSKVGYTTLFYVSFLDESGFRPTTFVGTKQAIDGTYANGVVKSGLNEELGLKGTSLEDARMNAKARPTTIDQTGANDIGVVYEVTTPLTKGFEVGASNHSFSDLFSQELKWVLKQAGATDAQIKTALKAAKGRTTENFLNYMSGFASRSKLNKETTVLRLRKMVDAKLQIMGFDHKVMSGGEKIPLVDVDLKPVEQVATHSNAEASFATAQLKKTFGTDADAIAETLRGAKELRVTYEHRLAELEQQVSQLVEEVGKEEEVLRLQAKADTVRAEQARLAEYQAADEMDELRDYSLDDTIPPHCI